MSTGAPTLEHEAPPMGEVIPNAAELAEMHELDPDTVEFIAEAREEIAEIVRGESPRLLVVLGPCSVDESIRDSGEYSYIELAERVAQFRDKHADELSNVTLALRGAVAKPRTNTGSDGLDSRDPILAHKLVTEAASMRLPIAMEIMAPDQLERYKDVIALGWMGARDVTSTRVRSAVSNVPDIPFLIKNGTTGDVRAAHDAQARIGERNVVTIEEAVPGITGAVVKRRVESPGNPNTAVLLRGGGAKTPEEFAGGVFKNFDQYGRPVFIDASHGNAKAHDINAEIERRDPSANPRSIALALTHIVQLSDRIPIQGVMFEMNLETGKDDPPRPGQSLTDLGIGIDEGLEAVIEMARHMDPSRD